MLATPREPIELGRACRASVLRLMLRIRLPFAVPFVFGGLKVAAALSVMAELVGADAGLGYLIQIFMAFFRTPLAFAAVVAMALMGMLLFVAVGLVEKLLFPWSSGAANR